MCVCVCVFVCVWVGVGVVSVTIKDINLINVTSTGGVTLPGVLLCDPKNPCTNINFDNVDNTGTHAAHPRLPRTEGEGLSLCIGWLEPLCKSKDSCMCVYFCLCLLCFVTGVFLIRKHYVCESASGRASGRIVPEIDCIKP